MDFITILMAAIYGAGSGFIFATIFWAKSGEAFDFYKYMVTLFLGCLVGGAMGVMGTPITEQTFNIQMLAYGFLTATIEAVLKMIFKMMNVPWPSSTP